jgi:GntR family transcriptional regulator
VIPASQKVAQMLDIDFGEKVFCLKRVRSVGSEPIVLSESYLPYQRFKELVDVDFTTERLFKTLEKMFKVRLAWASRSIAAIRAEAEEAAELNIEINCPLLYNEQIVYDDQNEKVEFSKGWFPGDRFRIRAIVQRRGKEGVESISLP